MARWGSSEVWVGEGLRREVFFLPSHGAELYGSVYAPVSLAEPSTGIVFCNSWGFEGNQASRIVHLTSLAFARAGGVAFNFHYPGFGDSTGDFERATIDALADAAVDAAHVAAHRYPETRWVLAGLMLGASIASLAADRGAQAERLLFVQPALRPERYFARLERASRRSIGQPPPVEGFAYGYPLSPEALDSATAADADVEVALSRFSGEGTIVRYSEPAELAGVPERFDHVVAEGAWRFGAVEYLELIRATSRWLNKDSGLLPR
jgi:pimeloyl-ACP methyl ester carboxylesterase